jgi:large subunit ribosomal protein L10
MEEDGMAVSRERKEVILARYEKILSRSEGLVVTEYRGMKMATFSELRTALREVKASYVVTKNRLLKIALEQRGFAVPEDLLSGPVAVGFAHGDLPGMVKAFLAKKKDNELLQLKGAIIGAQVLGPDDLEALSQLPTLEELRAQIAGMLVQPAQGVVNILAAPIQQLVGVVEAGASSLADVLDAYAAKQDVA